MIIFVMLLAVVILLSFCMKTNGKGTIADKFIKQENPVAEPFLSQRLTTIINGIFVLLIFFSHSTQYLTLSSNKLDSLYRHFQNFHNQWVVTTFLAFSGFGVMLKIMQGGVQYLKKYPRNRLLKTLINFDIAVIIFLVANTLLGIHYSGREIAGSFIGITSIGNSNWYIFTILVMYLVSYLAAVVLKDNYNAIAIAVTVCSVVYVAIAQITGLPSRFVSTVVTYALGMWIALYKDELERVFKNKAIVSLMIICIPILVTYKFRDNDYIMNLNSCFFVLSVVWFMAHFEIQSSILYFLGKHAFSIYILQRLPMLLISHFYTPVGMMNYVFVAICLLITVGIAVVFDKLLEKVDKIVLKT